MSFSLVDCLNHALKIFLCHAVQKNLGHECVHIRLQLLKFVTREVCKT